MSQKITVTKTEDHYEMQFDGGDAYPVPTNAIEELDDDLTPKEVGESVTFRGEYKGVKHMENFGVEEVLDAPGDDDQAAEGNGGARSEPRESQPETVAEPTPEHVAEVGYPVAAGQAQQAEAQRLFGIGYGDRGDADRKIEFDYVCPTCGADANDSTEKPYCSAGCAEEDIGGGADEQY